MAMEAQKLRFVRCPRCLQLLVEYPTIPLYQCGACGTVLKAKNRVACVAQGQSDSEYSEHSNVPSSLKGSPQNNKSICLDEQKIVSSNDQLSKGVVDGNISSTIKKTNSGESTVQERTVPLAESVTPAEHQNDKACSLIDGNGHNPGVMVKEIHDQGAGGNSSSRLIEKVEDIHSSDDANRCKVDNVDMNKMTTLKGVKGKTELVQSEWLHTYQSMHVESHEALLEELERSLSFSDDEDFSDEAENSGLSDALRNQMGSRRFVLGGKRNDSSRTDPHGRLIEELEMSFSDAEEPVEQIPMVSGTVHENGHDKSSQTLGAEGALPCEENISSFDSGLLKSEQTFHQENNEHLKSEPTFHQENMLIDNINHEDEDIDDTDTAKHSHEKYHIVVADHKIAESFQEKEHSKESQSAGTESAHPCEGSMGVSSVNDGSIRFEQSFKPNDLTADDNEENVEGHVEDDNMGNYVHGNENIVFSDEDTADRVYRNEELKTGGNGENEENHMEDDNMANSSHANQNISVVDDDITEKDDENEHSKDRQSLEVENTNLCEGISSFNAGDINSEQKFQYNELTADGTKEKEDDGREDINTASVKEDGIEDGKAIDCSQADSVAVASFSSLPNKRTQCKLPSFSKKNDIPGKCRASQLCQGLSLDSEDFKSIQNFIESQMDGTSCSVSCGSPNQGDLVHSTSNKFSNVGRHERLKKMDELRDQLSRLSSQKSLEKRYQKRCPEYQQQPSSYDVEQHLRSVDADSIPSSCALESYYGHGRPPRYHQPNPFSPTHTYTHSHFGHAQTHIPHSYDAWEFSSYYQSSYAESTILDHESLRSYKEQKRVVRKHILRPLSGASPFTICNSCFNLVQTPSDIYISKAKIGKMQCGHCSKVLVLSFPVGCLAEANISKDLAQLSNKTDGNIIANNEDATSYSAEYIRGPVSANEKYGASFTRSISTQAETSLAATLSGKKVSDSALHRLMGYDSASQLLRHSRTFEDGYESFESMVPISSRVSRRKNM
ncbi:hypothetical protein ACP4OV_003345 [Aristida adscensionis]